MEDQDKIKRLDQVVAERFDLSRAKAKQLVELGAVTYLGEVIEKPSTRVEQEDAVVVDTTVEIPEVEKKELPLSAFNVRLVHEAPDFLVVEKPAGLLVHPTRAKENTTLVAWLLKHYPDIKDVGEGPWRSGIVHRLDRYASGLLVIPRTQAMHAHLKKQFQKRTVQKEYTVLVHGNIEAEHDVIEFLIDRGSSGKMVARPNHDEVTLQNVNDIQSGKESKTEFWITDTFLHYTLLRVKIHTGRTHQIRVHMHAYGHPVVGDTLYFQKRYTSKHAPELDRLFLHATKLSFLDQEGEAHSFDAPLPQQLVTFLAELKRDPNAV